MTSTRIVTVNNNDLILNTYKSTLRTSATSGSSTISVQSIANFAVNKILLIGEPGSEGSEIINTSASVAPSGNTVTLASNLTKDHPSDVSVYVILFDQVEFSYSATIGGANSVLAISNVDPEQEETMYTDSTHSNGYYYTRFKNSIFGTFGDYSDPIPFDGVNSNTVSFAFTTAMDELYAKYSKKLTYELLLGWTNQMLRLVRGKLKKWGEYETFNYDMADLVQGVQKYAIPTDVYNQNGISSFMNVRIGNDLPLIGIDNSEYIIATENVTYTEVTTQPTIGDTTLTLDDTNDLDDSGTVSIFVSGTKYDVTYTTNTRSTNTLSGIPASGDGSITYAFPIDSPTWQNISQSTPQYFSVQNGYMYLWPMISSDFAGHNLIVDYQSDITEVNSDGDVIYGPRFDMLIQFLKWKIKGVIKGDGNEDLKDPSYLQFREILSDATRNDQLNDIQAFRPRKYAVLGGRKHNSRR